MLRLLVSDTFYLNLNIILYYIYFFSSKMGLDYVIIYSIFTVFSFIEFHKLIIFKLKYSFLCLYYYYYFNFLTKAIVFVENYIITIICKNNYIYINLYYLLREYSFLTLVIFNLLKDLLYNFGHIYMGFLKYYILYKFILVVYKFFLRFIYDFDLGTIMLYDPKSFLLTELGIKKLYLYHYYLIKNTKNILFMNAQFFELFKDKKNVLFFFIAESSLKNEILKFIFFK